MFEFLNNLIKNEMFISVLSGAAIFLFIYSVGTSLFDSKKKWTRFDRIKRKELQHDGRKRFDTDAIRKSKDSGFTSRIVSALNLKSLLEDKKVKENLIKAGLSHDRAFTIFYFMRFATPVATGLFAAFFMSFVNNFDLDYNQQILVIIVAIAIGLYAPSIYVSNIAARRQEKIIRTFPDALDMLLVCVEAGTSIEQAFIKVASEIGDAAPELAEEMALTNAELSYLQERRLAYSNLARRNPDPGIKSVATALIQSEKYGTPVGSALRVMAGENRELRMTRAERKAAALPTKMTVPMIIFFLPVIFIVILGPIAVRYLG